VAELAESALAGHDKAMARVNPTKAVKVNLFIKILRFGYASNNLLFGNKFLMRFYSFVK
jgi:hypothetical protein